MPLGSQVGGLQHYQQMKSSVFTLSDDFTFIFQPDDRNGLEAFYYSLQLNSMPNKGWGVTELYKSWGF